MKTASHKPYLQHLNDSHIYSIHRLVFQICVVVGFLLLLLLSFCFITCCFVHHRLLPAHLQTNADICHISNKRTIEIRTHLRDDDAFINDYLFVYLYISVCVFAFLSLSLNVFVSFLFQVLPSIGCQLWPNLC